jgi:two-component system response regulator WspF
MCRWSRKRCADRHATPDFTVAWIARDGLDAVAKAHADHPDVILMDIMMPVMDGVEATRRIMAGTPCAILLVTATVSGNLTMVFDALGHGALDVVQTPGFGVAVRTTERRIPAQARGRRTPGQCRGPRPERPRPGHRDRCGERRDDRVRRAVRRIHAVRPVARVPGRTPATASATMAAYRPVARRRSPRSTVPGLPAAVVIVQHLDARFSDSFVAWLRDRRCSSPPPWPGSGRDVARWRSRWRGAPA